MYGTFMFLMDLWSGQTDRHTDGQTDRQTKLRPRWNEKTAIC